MKTSIFIVVAGLISSIITAQVTQINSNKSLRPLFALSPDIGFLYSQTDSTLWKTDGSPAGTIQLSATIKYLTSTGGVINSKFIFVGSTVATGTELFYSDGSVAGTGLLKDLYTGTVSSFPQHFTKLHGNLFFTCATPVAGRELWKTDGTVTGTVMVKDILPGTADMNRADSIQMFSNGSKVFFSAKATGKGNELWVSDGTEAGTKLVKDINPGVNAPSNPEGFFKYNNLVLFVANDGTTGKELWKTDGTEAGTTLLKDINPGGLNSFAYTSFRLFNNKVYFIADNTIHGPEIWSTNGTASGTTMLTDLNPGILGCYATLVFSMNIGGKLIFPAFTNTTGFELWSTDGTAAGTVLLKDIEPGTGSSSVTIMPSLEFDTATGTYSLPLFLGNKIFMMANTLSKGFELWITDGTPSGTQLVKDIHSGDSSSMANSVWFYTTTALYFSANNGTHGYELWKSDGTAGNTTLVADINPGMPSSGIMFGFVVNNKLVFQANNGDNTKADLYRLDANVQALPVVLSAFSVAKRGDDAILTWSTSSEINCKNFTIQRSEDGVQFKNIGVIESAGASSIIKSYFFRDAGIIKSNVSIIYYRLELANMEGETDYSPTIKIQIKETNKWMVKLSTNPVKSVINVQVTGINEKVNIVLRDATGKIVLKNILMTTPGSLALPAGKLMPGIYILTAESGLDKKIIQFVKE